MSIISQGEDKKGFKTYTKYDNVLLEPLTVKLQ